MWLKVLTVLGGKCDTARGRILCIDPYLQTACCSSRRCIGLVVGVYDRLVGLFGPLTLLPGRGAVVGMPIFVVLVGSVGRVRSVYGRSWHSLSGSVKT